MSPGNHEVGVGVGAASPYSNPLFDNGHCWRGKALPSSVGSTGLEGPLLCLVGDAIQICSGPLRGLTGESLRLGACASPELSDPQAFGWGSRHELPSLCPKSHAGHTEAVVAMDTVGSPHKAHGSRWS